MLHLPPVSPNVNTDANPATDTETSFTPLPICEPQAGFLGYEMTAKH